MVLLCDGRWCAGAPIRTASACSATRRTTGVTGVWTGETAAALRRDINAGGSKFCGDCPLKLPLRKDAGRRRSARLDVGTLPSRLYVECTAACNISCAQACCAPETGITRTRQAGMLDFELFKPRDRRSRAVARPGRFLQLRRGVPPQARDRDVRVHQGRFPHIYLYTSTNGLAFTEDSVARLVHSGIDEVTFSIDGATAESYVKYRQRGDFAKAIRNLRAAARRQARARARRAVHQLALHPLHAQRLRRGDGRSRGRLAERDGRRPSVLGADRSSRGHVLAPLRAGQRRARRHPPRDLGRQQSRQRHPRRHAARARSTSAGPLVRACRSCAGAGRP